MDLDEEKIYQERYDLCMERIAQIASEETVAAPFVDYFQKMASFIMQMKELFEKICSGEPDGYSCEQWEELNHSLYEDILPENYADSYGNPDYAVRKLGEIHGRILSFLYTELRGMIAFAFEGRMWDMVIICEVFIEIYNCFEEEELPAYKKIQQVIYWFISDYSDLTVTRRIQESIDPELDFAVQLIMNEDLSDLRYLYKFGEYITENERKTAAYLNSLDQETIDLMASTYTEGYRIGFEKAKIDLSAKETVNIRYNLGFERMIRAAIQNFEKMGLRPVIYRAAVNSINKRQQLRIGYYGAIPNKQFDYDHRADQAIYLDKPFVERKLGVLRTAYEKFKDLANRHAGPACVEIFGEQPFIPENKAAAYHMSEKQEKLTVFYSNESAQITNRYIKGDERSFTIIAFPIPEIGEQFEEIFREIIKVNTLDYQLYERIQQTIIEALDQGSYVHILGKGENHTDLNVRLHELQDPAIQTNFENCVADVNIPVGEVFTSPQLAGTSGVLQVKEVYLGELQFVNLSIAFEDGMIKEYTCGNFENEEDNKRYILENVLYHHETLPMGEFAIGTNTTAYAVARKYKIADKLPILIAEKMGPHFAVGDTCYSWSEDITVHNPDGREVIAKDNAVSILRKEDIGKAYMGCHTDITIPYDELELIEVVKPDGTKTEIIRDGKFVLKGTEELNQALDE
ncbi:aminopeptidase [uncultured Robinsoniella sp.]|uniref:aminopeptidase n=1 Tax=uncultured Robinsoniella sp. TaxID=904190 RepID=UPI00374F7516